MGLHAQSLTVLLHGRQQTLDFRALGSGRRQAAQELFGLVCGLGATPGVGQGDRETEPPLVKVGSDRERALQRIDRVLRPTGIRARRYPQLAGWWRQR